MNDKIKDVFKVPGAVHANAVLAGRISGLNTKLEDTLDLMAESDRVLQDLEDDFEEHLSEFTEVKKLAEVTHKQVGEHFEYYHQKCANLETKLNNTRDWLVLNMALVVAEAIFIGVVVVLR